MLRTTAAALRQAVTGAALPLPRGHAAIRRLLADPATTSDTLLTLADEIELVEAGEAERGLFDAAAQLNAAVTLLRLLAPVYADVPLPDGSA
jgi:hypothetical protein